MLGSHCAMSPGARTIPAAMVLPTAAEIPNHMPRTLRRRPRLCTAKAMESRVPPDAGALGVEDRSDGFSNCRVSGTLRNFAMIMGTGKNASRKWRVAARRFALDSIARAGEAGQWTRKILA